MKRQKATVQAKQQERIITIKMALGSIMQEPKRNAIQESLDRVVIAISHLCRLGSLNVLATIHDKLAVGNLQYFEQVPDILSLFKQLQRPTPKANSRPLPPVTETFAAAMAEYNTLFDELPRSLSNLKNCINYAAQRCETMFMMNIASNLKQRLRAYLRNTHQNDYTGSDLRYYLGKTMGYIFHGFPVNEVPRKILQTMRIDLELDDARIAQLRTAHVVHTCPILSLAAIIESGTKLQELSVSTSAPTWSNSRQNR